MPDKPIPYAAVSPEKSELADQTVEEVYRSLNRLPIFMTELDETDGAGGENIALEAIRALVHEGTAIEVAQNFKEQGNSFARARAWKDARDCYNQALTALKAPCNPGEGMRPDELDTDSAAAKDESAQEREIEEKCFVNRALCNLELHCAAALRLNPKNMKAIYRCAMALMALDDITRAKEASSYGRKLDPLNESFKILARKLSQRKDILYNQQQKRQDHQDRIMKQTRTLKAALKMRNIVIKLRSTAPEMEDAVIHLTDPVDISSTLILPILLLYPLNGQTDLIKSCSEQSTVIEHLEYVLPPPWDEKREYEVEDVDCLMETTKGGIVKVGKRLSLKRILGDDNVELVDNMAKLQIVPKARVNDWITSWKRKQGCD